MLLGPKPSEAGRGQSSNLRGDTWLMVELIGEKTVGGANE